MERLAKDLWRWTARHPEWHPGEFGAEVVSFAARSGGDLLLIDPLLPPDPEPVFKALDDAVRDRVAIVITIPYHVRSSEDLWKRYRKDAETTIHGHKACRKRLNDESAFRELKAGEELPAAASAHNIGKPRRFETPLHLAKHDALVFGDAVAETGGRLVVWSERRVDEKVERFYRERFNPTLKPLLELDFDRVLVTHGEPVLKDGKAALRKAMRAKPWYHRP
jgi:hypothetical protein